ncbi:MAG: ATP-binding protein [Emcibacteraceae bacterium]|nr:ATP-binding protein [Emcibacteraceae bacterium]
MIISQLLPKSITGQLLAIIITAITTLQIVYIVADYIDELDEEQVIDDYYIRHISELHRVMISSTPSMYEDIIDLGELYYLSYSISDNALSSKAAFEELINLEKKFINTLDVDQNDVLISYQYNIDPSFDIRDDGYGDHSDIQKTIISVNLQNGKWLNVALNIHEHGFGYYSPFNIYISLSIIIIAISIFVLLRVTRPLVHLTKSIEKFSKDFKVSKVQEEGPADLKQAIKSFNLMQEDVADHIDRRVKTLTAISHDIRTPLTSLRIKAELMDEGEEKQGIITSVNKMENITASAIEFLKGGNEAYNKKQVNLSALLETECTELSDLGKPVDYSGDKNLITNCDPDSISRAVHNLIDNAIKYGDRAAVTLSREKNKAIISVKDDGNGIEDAELSKVLEPFERLDKERHSDKGGFGLGLSIANDIAKAHGGKLILSNHSKGGLIATLQISI